MERRLCEKCGGALEPWEKRAEFELYRCTLCGVQSKVLVKDEEAVEAPSS